ncbi:solute carrier family 13 member 2-like [Saccostrea echinata]|uniref:solute carrier family 13 member 2-like n=1 Tax=Saccostrea echinata TaxID=191078 RepID=UPI002A7F95AC|nr:solute carrier family 13 member 2-like [Saccostrea echinata]
MAYLDFLRSLWAIRKWIFILLAFILPCDLLTTRTHICMEDDKCCFNTTMSRCAYVIIVMAILWITEALPIAATALMPIFLLPMLGVQNGRDVSKNYVNDTSMLFLGGLFIAAAMEDVNLHRRIAVGVMRILGSRVNTLMLGLMLPTWFLSMWISNTAATSMMLPILIAITEQMRKLDQTEHVDPKDTDEKNGVVKVEGVTLEMEEKTDVRQQNDDLKWMSKGFALCVAYGANIGGIATLTGTPPNLVLQGQADIFYAKYGETGSGITYVNWMGLALPMSVLLLLLAWLYLQIVFLRGKCCKTTEKIRKKAIQSAVLKEWKDLGKMTFAEIEVFVLFCILALLWVFRSLPDVGGWGDLFTDVKTGKTSTARDSTASILVACLLFILPREIPNVFCCFKKSETNQKPGYRPILTWDTAQSKVSWGVIFLLGGGFALANAASTTGLTSYIGCELKVFENLDRWVMNLLVCLLVSAVTEITSNTAIASIIMPIIFELAISVGLHPLYLMISSTIACSFAFCLPVATPPNAIVFSSGFIKIPEMFLTGLFMNIIAILTVTLAINTWGSAIYNLDTMPAIFAAKNVNSSSGNLSTTSLPFSTTVMCTTSVDSLTTT